MKKFKPKPNEFIGEIKKMVVSFIENSESLNLEQKNKLKSELGNNWCDDRFNGELFVDTAINQAELRWRIDASNQMDFW